MIEQIKLNTKIIVIELFYTNLNAAEISCLRRDKAHQDDKN